MSEIQQKIQPYSAFRSKVFGGKLNQSAFMMREEASFRGPPITKVPVRRCNCLIHITHPLRVKWDLLVMFLAIYNCFSIPFSVSFIPENDSDIIFVIDTVIDCMFFLDIILNFRTTYTNIKTGDEVTNGCLIAKNYISGGKFFIDLLATVPFDTFGELFGASSGELQLFSLLKLIRILRLSKIILYLRTKEDVKLMLRFLQFILFLVMYIHVVACGWYLLVTSARQEWSPPIPKNPDYYKSDIVYKYAFALYSSVAMLVGIEVMPQSFQEIVFCSFVILLGAMITAVMFGEMAVIMANINRASIRFNDIMNHVNTTMKNLKLPQSLQYKISDHLVSTQSTLAQQEEYKKFKKEIPPSLRAQVNNVLFEKVIRSTPVFSEYPRVTRDIISHTDNHFYKPEEDIVRQGEESDGMFFLLIGLIEVIIEDLNGIVKRIKILKAGDYFGEIGVLFNSKRTATVRVLEYATVAKIDTESLVSTLENYPDIKMCLKEKAIYHDDLTRGLDKLLKRVSFIRKINHMQYYHLLHCMKFEKHSAGTILLNSGDLATKIYFLIEGKVDILFGMKGKETHYTIRMHDLEDSCLYRSESLLPIPKPSLHTINPEFDLFICSFRGVSIFCAKQALIKVPVPVKIQTSTVCTFLVLSTSDIESISQLEDGNLAANLALLRSKYDITHTRREEIIKKYPIVDASQNFVSKIEGFKTKSRLKFKHSVLKVVMRNRHRRSIRISIYPIVQRMISIVKSGIFTWPEIRKLIENGHFPADHIEIAQILHASDKKNPVMKQMGSIAQDTQEGLWKIENKLKDVGKVLEDMENRSNKTGDDIKEFREMSMILSSLLNHKTH